MSKDNAGDTHHTHFRDVFKGAAHVFHGLGDDIRGSVMGAVESLSGSEEGKAKDAEVASKGRAEIEQGIAQIKGTADADAGSAAAPASTGDQPPERQTSTKEDASGVAQTGAVPLGLGQGAAGAADGPGESVQPEEGVRETDAGEARAGSEARTEGQNLTAEGAQEIGSSA